MKQINEPVMTAEDALELIMLFEQNQIEVTLDGGWGVDALIGQQTRAHTDLDIVIAYNDVTRLRELLEARGYRDEPDPEARECNFLMGDGLGHYVDIHTVSFDPVEHPEYGSDYPIESLNGKGSISGYPVRCISLEYMVKFHTGYEVDETDFHDVKALCQHFGIEMPAVYNRFEEQP
jgi:lincosamide nucleotidyltransferase A/C/D/E